MSVLLAATIMFSALTADVEQVAAEAGVDPMDLAGAVVTTGLDPRTYLIKVGELAPPMSTPRDYLYGKYPYLAKRLDCVFARESEWKPSAVNRKSGASGLAQAMAGTWASTPQGRAGMSRLDPYASIDAAAWLVTSTPKSWRHWDVVKMGYC